MREGAFGAESLATVNLRCDGVIGWAKERWMRKRALPAAEATAYPAGGGLTIFRMAERVLPRILEVLVSINGRRVFGPEGPEGGFEELALALGPSLRTAEVCVEIR